MNNRITESLTEVQTHLLGLIQIVFVNRVGVPVVMHVKNVLWLPTFFDRVQFCFAEDERLRSNIMIVCFRFCQSLLQSKHSTKYRRSFVGSLNDKLHLSTRAVF